ncbi:hypothetical protein [Anaeromicropila populeti]|uniref:Uncharacterized protein n=1 Tax=Anaeromicropila populeti TaxID=37658 RepID=A0A1I6LZP6_9FIRM|nr:hypothetical protein [Anaeromicropila populeti]SFS08926.1 hypothetical protein SAMN05661086_03698 [Anaeromicropila populeti]
MKTKYFKRIIMLLLCIITVFVIYNVVVWNQSNRKLINPVLLQYRKYFKLDYINCNSEKKEISYGLVDKYIFWGEKKCKLDAYNDIRLKLNRYLEKNPDYYLNNGYKITIYFKLNISGKPSYLHISNYNETVDELKIYNGFYHVSGEPMSGSNFENISDYAVFDGIKSLKLDQYVIFDDVSKLTSLSSLEYVVIGGTDSAEKQKELNEVLPNCSNKMSKIESQ